MNITNNKILDSGAGKDREFMNGFPLKDPEKTVNDPLLETACFKFMKPDQPELPKINTQAKHGTTRGHKKKTMDSATIKQKVLITPSTPHQRMSFGKRRSHDRKNIFSENQVHRNPISNPISMKYKQRCFDQNSALYSRHFNPMNFGKFERSIATD